MAVAGKLIIALVAALTLAPAAAAAPKTYFDAAACIADGAHGAAQCRQAYRNARAEFDEKAPRFPTRAACERFFPRCMIADIFRHGGVDFMPVMRGFVFVEGRRSLAAPVAEGGGVGLFEPRAADRADEAIDPRRAAAARSAWLLKFAPLSGRREVAEPESSAAATEGSRAFPVPKAMLIELRERERRYAGTAKDRDQ